MIPTYFTADVATEENAEFLAALPELVANGCRVGVEGTTVTVTGRALDILADFGDDDDGAFDGAALWIGGSSHTVRSAADGLPLGLRIDQLAEELSHDWEVELSAATEVITAGVGQVSGGAGLWDAERGLVIGAGVQLVREFARDDIMSARERQLLVELQGVVEKARGLGEARDVLIRKLMGTSVRRADIAAAAEVSEPRLYQIVKDSV